MIGESWLRRAPRFVSIQLLILLVLGLVAEFGLRLVKSFVRDGGTITLAHASINSRPGGPYGWNAPQDTVVRYQRPCYGKIEATYNKSGQRLAYEPKLQKAEGIKRVCVVGDSSTQAYQISDGRTFYHQLQKRLHSPQTPVEILPMAVGGFGPLQQAMLLKNLCLPYQPDLIVWQLDRNDLNNSSYRLERYAGRDNNFRRRPYYEDGKVVWRRPMLIPDFVDSVALRLINAALLRFAKDEAAAFQAEEDAKASIKGILQDYLGPLPAPVLFIFSNGGSPALGSLFSAQGYAQVAAPKPPDELTCLRSGDSHRNALGHRDLADRLEPKIRTLLWPTPP